MKIDLSEVDQPRSCKPDDQGALREIVIEDGAVGYLEELMESGFLRKYIHPVIICDTNTFEATEEIMENIYDRCEVIMMEAEGLLADETAVEIIRANRVEDMDLILAVGSGTIHDLSRYIAYEEGIPVVSVPTAASEGGFLSDAAEMVYDGKIYRAKAAEPICVIADTDIVSGAPESLNASGMSGLSESYVKLKEWQKNHKDEWDDLPILKKAKSAVKQAANCMDGISEGDPDDCEKLICALLLAELALRIIEPEKQAE
ncbi:MAG: iron-containing alcohol dehydrogenase [Lachnospiraceae bacterium]|nr:iron-containing alcohol dehydrogenase [Lachnospiraceae bacterium]MDD6619054.1 iron-containing alcohol dehydrogenase [Clostridiales bacterium]MDY4771559.1 iron-containing alcohol dehydrogenase [Lachnospiraceae bacterium]